jgi:hypothetical protein
MGKKIALLFSVLLFAVFFFFLVFYSEEPGDVETLKPGVYAGEVRQAHKLSKNLSPALDPSEVRLCFRGEELACDRTTNTFYLPVDMELEEWEAGSFTDASGDIQILPMKDYTLLDKKQLVADGTPVEFLAWKEEEEICTKVWVVFTGLSVVRMETDADLDVDTVFAGSVVFYEACGGQNWTTTSVFQAHERGQTSRTYPKKGYRVNLISVTSTGVVNKKEESVLGMRTSDSWIFYAIYSDGTKVRDKFNTELWNRFGAEDTPYDAHYGTHMEYAELFVNGEYRGLYGILEPVDSDQLQISDQEYLYKRTYGRELTDELFDAADPEEYLTVLGVEIKGKKNAETARDWACFRSFVRLSESEDEVFAEEAPEFLSMDNLADMWIYLQLICGEDNIYKNMFFAFKKEADGYRLYLVPWDTDLTWGNIYVDDESSLYVASAPERADWYLEWPFADRMLSLNAGGFKELVQKRWQELRSDLFSEEKMDELLQNCIHQVQDSGAFARDAARWPDSSYDGNYESLESFMKTRLVYMDKMIQE